MREPDANVSARGRSRGRRCGIAAWIVLGGTGLAACDGTAVVTLTASQTHFLAYRVGLVSVALQGADGSNAVQVLTAATNVDLARLVDVDEVLGTAAAIQGRYPSVVVTVDYGAAHIVADDGTPSGATLTAVDASGMPLGRVALTVRLDPKNQLRVAANKTSSLALDFKLAASNVVNLVQKTVVVTPMIAASTVPLDTKPILVRGPITDVNAAGSDFTTGITPFDGPAQGGGRLTTASSDSTVYEIDGKPSTGAAGLTALAGIARGDYAIATGGWTGTATVGSDAQNVAFTAADVLAGTSARSAQFDRLAGVVIARSGNSLTLSAATLVPATGAAAGTGATSIASAAAFVDGTAIVEVGTGTAVTAFGQANTAVTHSIREISVGSRIAAFGAATTDAAGNLALDATAGRVRLYPVDAGGIVRQAGGGSLTLALATLAERDVTVFSFAGTGSSTASDADPAAYAVATGQLPLANAGVGGPVAASGFVAPFGAAPPDFAATSLADRTTIPAVLTIDWSGAGTPTPFASLGTAQILVDIRDSRIGAQHAIEVGAQQIDLTSLAADPAIVAAASTNVVYAIGHSASASIDNYDRFTDFVGALQSDLRGASATGMTAEGVYTASTNTLAATSVTVYLAD